LCGGDFDESKSMVLSCRWAVNPKATSVKKIPTIETNRPIERKRPTTRATWGDLIVKLGFIIAATCAGDEITLPRAKPPLGGHEASAGCCCGSRLCE